MFDPDAFQAPDEYSPMSGLDEYMVHNNPLPIRAMWTSDPQAYERLWFSAFDKTGDILVLVGMGFYPNLGTADAFALVNYRGQHTTVRGQRMLGADRMNMSIGPIKLEVVKPFEQWRLSLAENEFGISFEIDWFDTKRAVFQDWGNVIVDNTTYNPMSGYETFGCQAGWVKIDGETHELTRDEFQGSRDHHWGVRDSVGGPSPKPMPGFHPPHHGEFVEFDDFGLFARWFYYNRGDERSVDHIESVERRLRFDPDTHFMLAGEVDLRCRSGMEKKYSFERIGNQIGFLRCAMYGGWGGKGGTPDGDLWHGRFSGELAVTGETYDVNDPAVQLHISGLEQFVARFECDGEVAYGMVETLLEAYDAAVEDSDGLSLLE